MIAFYSTVSDSIYVTGRMYLEFIYILSIKIASITLIFFFTYYLMCLYTEKKFEGIN